MVGLRHGKGDCGEGGTCQVVDAVLQECEAEALSAIASGDAELGDVGHVGSYAGA